MIDIALIDEPVNLKEYKVENIEKPTLFLGFIVKNEYDNKRLLIDKKYNPKKFSLPYKNGKHINLLPLYGIIVKVNNIADQLGTLLSRQERYENTLNLMAYQNILTEYNLSCNDSYAYFYKNIYPIDNRYFDMLTDEDIGKDKRIFQHMLNLDENKFDFQKFGSLKLLLLT